MASTITLIHSPLLGPTSWRWVADELVDHGHRVEVPSIVAGASSGSWETCVRLAVPPTPTDDEAMLVGHSGAGPLLPLIAEAMIPPPTRLVFVDASVPPEHGETSLIPGDVAGHLHAIARDDGLLPPWSEWFGPDAIAALIPDGQRRHDVMADMPEVPLSYFDGRIPLPERWSDAADGAYVLLSDTYRADALEARSRGWTVIEMTGGHMDLVTRPTALASALGTLAAR